MRPISNYFQNIKYLLANKKIKILCIIFFTAIFYAVIPNYTLLLVDIKIDFVDSEIKITNEKELNSFKIKTGNDILQDMLPTLTSRESLSKNIVNFYLKNEKSDRAYVLFIYSDNETQSELYNQIDNFHDFIDALNNEIEGIRVSASNSIYNFKFIIFSKLMMSCFVIYLVVITIKFSNKTHLSKEKTVNC